MQNHIDKQYDIMEENKRSLRRRLDKRRNESESKRPGTSSEEESTEEKEGNDTTSSLDSEDEELPPLGHGDRVEAKFSSSKTKGTGSIIKVNHRKQTYNILFDNGKRRSNFPRSEIKLIMSLSNLTIAISENATRIPVLAVIPTMTACQYQREIV